MEQVENKEVNVNWSLFDKNKPEYQNLSAHDLAREFYRSQHPDVAERARNDSKFRNIIDCFLGFPNQNLCIRR